MKSILTVKERIFLSSRLNQQVADVYFEDVTLDEQLTKEFISIRSKINSSYPLDYLIGSIGIEDLDLALIVNEYVLLPRQETIDWIKTCVFDQWISDKIKVYELGTGSGLIALYLVKSGYTVTATDISKDALLVAQENSRRNNMDSNITFLKADLLDFADSDTHINSGNSWNVVANLPYVPDTDKHNKTYESIKFEPETALFSGDDGLDSIRALVLQIGKRENKPDTVVLELDPRNIHQASDLFEQWYTASIYNDSAGHPRTLILKLKSLTIH